MALIRYIITLLQNLVLYFVVVVVVVVESGIKDMFLKLKKTLPDPDCLLSFIHHSNKIKKINILPPLLILNYYYYFNLITYILKF